MSEKNSEFPLKILLVFKKISWYTKKALVPAIRGFLYYPFFSIGSKPLMIGSRVTILYRRKIHAGWMGYIGANQHDDGK